MTSTHFMQVFIFWSLTLYIVICVPWQVLYSFISFGVVFDPSVVTEYDPPEHLFRIRLVCMLLETCGQFFSSGSSKRRLDCFLTYFQVSYNKHWDKEYTLYNGVSKMWRVDSFSQGCLFVRHLMWERGTCEWAEHLSTRTRIWNQSQRFVVNLPDHCIMNLIYLEYCSQIGFSGLVSSLGSDGWLMILEYLQVLGVWEESSIWS